ncbi:MAG: hypothetical protein ACTSYS_04180 [Promethearchaeota archaeon]
MNQEKSLTRLKIVLGISLISISILVPVGSMFSGVYVMFNDGELLPDGRVMICQYEIWRFMDQDLPGQRDSVLFVEPDGRVSMRLGEPNIIMDRPHEALMLDNGNVLIADTHNDRIIEVTMENKIAWEYNIRDLNWTEVDPVFTADNLVNNFVGDDWSHVNDVELTWKNGSQYMLVSCRNFDMVFEVNYTSAHKSNITKAMDITWYYGFPGNWSLIKQQHNADYLSNGNIMVADSENGRCLEINYTSKQVAWETPESLDLYWPRDCDVNPANESLVLITDSLNHRVIEYDRDNDVITWKYSQDIIQPYQSDYLGDDRIIIADGVGGNVLIINKSTNQIIWEYSAPMGSRQFIQISVFFIMLVLATSIVFLVIDKVKHDKGKKKIYWFNLASCVFWLVFLFIIFLYPQSMLKPIILTIDKLIRGNN